jgi:hypothetical protein
MSEINLNGSDRIVRPTFGRTDSHNASNAETLIMVAVAFGTAALMLFGAYHFVAWIYSLSLKRSEWLVNQPTLVTAAENKRFGVGGTVLINGRVPSNDNFSTAAMDKYIALQRVSADLAGLSVQRRAEEEASIAAANAKLEDGAAALYNQDGSVRKFVTSYKEAVGVIGQGTAKEVEGLAATIARGKAWDKVRETVGQYLQQMNAEADAAGQTTLQRSIDLDIIKAGEISQKGHVQNEKDINKTLAANTKELGQQNVDAIRIADTRKILAPIEKQIGDQLKLSGIALAANRDQRELALQIAQQELSTGAQLTDQDKERLRIAQQKNDATHMKDYLEDLRTEVKLAGMSADERERESAAIQAGHNRATSAQQDEIRGLIATRQETERWRQVVDDVSTGFQGFFEDVLNNGKLSFSSLWDSIKQSFVKMLAYMATQALVAPIIIPMVQSFAGGIGGLFGGGSAGSGGALNLLASAGSIFGGGVSSTAASLFGGGGSAGNWAGSIMDDGTILGGGSAASGGGLFGNIGNLFGGGGSILGGSGSLLSRLVPGAAIAYASSMLGTAIFGNKNDTGLGGALLGLPGAFLGSLTGSSNNGAISNFTDGGLGNTLFKAGGGNNGQMATTASGNINTALKALKDAGVDVNLGNISGLSIGSDKSYVYDFAGGKQKLVGGEAGVQATVNAILDRILPSASSGDSAVNDLLQKYGGLNSGNIGAFSTELQAISDQKDQDAKDAAAAATNALADQFGTLGDDIKTFASTVQDSSKAFSDAANGWEKSRDNLIKANQALLISAPGLSPTEQYSNSRSQFDSLLNSARGGNSQSASDLASFAGQFLQSSFSYNGSTTAYGSDLSYVKDTLNGLADFSEAQRSFAQRQADAMDASVAQLSSIYNAIGNAANQNNDGLELLRQEVADLTAQVKSVGLFNRTAA